MVDLLRFSPRVTRSLRSLPCTQALFESLDSSRDVTIMGNFKNTKSQGKTQREKGCGGSYFCLSRDPLRRDHHRKSQEAPGYEAAPQLQADL